MWRCGDCFKWCLGLWMDLDIVSSLFLHRLSKMIARCALQDLQHYQVSSRRRSQVKTFSWTMRWTKTNEQSLTLFQHLRVASNFYDCVPASQKKRGTYPNTPKHYSFPSGSPQGKIREIIYWYLKGAYISLFVIPV